MDKEKEELIFPIIDELTRLVKNVQKDISDEYRAYPEDTEPGIQLTVACDEKGWSYQTGDNSFTGGAYGYKYWAVTSVHRDSNVESVAKYILDELEEVVAASGE